MDLLNTKVSIGAAFASMHKHIGNTSAINTVHIGVEAAMSGVSRFGESRSGRVVYSKAENLPSTDLKHFDWLLTSSKRLVVYTTTYYSVPPLS